jgi:hypothetical protein
MTAFWAQIATIQVEPVNYARKRRTSPVWPKAGQTVFSLRGLSLPPPLLFPKGLAMQSPILRTAFAVFCLTPLSCLTAAIAGCLFCGCGTNPEERHAIATKNDWYGDSTSRIVYLEQGWTPLDSDFFYTVNQGSRLVPYQWFLALEQPDNQGLLRDEKNVRRLRFLAQAPSPLNPDGLPVGFVRDPAQGPGDSDWLGLTCAACHTSQINYKGAAYRIDGGPGQGDIQTFLLDLTKSLQKTHEDPAVFERFAKRVLGHSTGDEAQRTALRKELADVHHARQQFDERNATKSVYGFGRVDAFGIILNEVLVHALEVPENRGDPNAPVSYPFLWDTPQHDFVQWNGVAPNRPLNTHIAGPLARNVGEVLGVFGEVTVPSSKDTTLYASSARIVNLFLIEEMLKRLQSPRWPKEFPPIDEKLAGPGREVFLEHCERCHHSIERSDLARQVQAEMTPLDELKTDPNMARNFAGRVAITGPLQGRRKLLSLGERFEESAPAGAILRHVVIGVIKQGLDQHDPAHHLQELAELGDNLSCFELMFAVPTDMPLAYKGRPLNGIWATAPFLHNGSVPNLYQLLLPPKDRQPFHLGSREFDPENVGLVSSAAPGAFAFRIADDHGQPISGNSNAGHEYGTGADGKPALSPDQRRQLLEYLKKL